MATLFSPEFADVLTPIFVFIFVFALLYALLAKTKFFGDKSGFNLVIAFATSMLILIIPESQVVISVFTPWMGLLVVLMIFIFMFFIFLGVKSETMAEFTKSSGFAFWVVLIIVILFLVALTKAFGPFLMTNQNPGFWNAVKRVVFHPKTLGALLVLAIAAYAIRYIGSNE